MTPGINNAFELLSQDKREWEIGDEDFVVLNDGLVLVEMQEGGNLKIKVLLATPKFLNEDIGIATEGAKG